MDYREFLDKGAKGCIDKIEEKNHAIKALDDALTAIRVAENTGVFRSEKLAEALESSRLALGKISETIKTTETACKNWQAIRKICSGVSALRDNSMIEKDPIGAATAFGDLFSGLGELANSLPQPAKAYAPMLQRFDRKFFVNTVSNLVPQLRANQRDSWKAERDYYNQR